MVHKTADRSKQRLRMYNASNKDRRIFMSSHLDAKLRERYNRRSIPPVVGDKVKILRGEFRGMTGKIERVDRKNYKLYIEGINRERADGTKRGRPVHPSNVMITELALKDRVREKMLGRK